MKHKSRWCGILAALGWGLWWPYSAAAGDFAYDAAGWWFERLDHMILVWLLATGAYWLAARLNQDAKIYVRTPLAGFLAWFAFVIMSVLGTFPHQLSRYAAGGILSRSVAIVLAVAIAVLLVEIIDASRWFLRLGAKSASQ